MIFNVAQPVLNFLAYFLSWIKDRSCLRYALIQSSPVSHFKNLETSFEHSLTLLTGAPKKSKNLKSTQGFNFRACFIVKLFRKISILFEKYGVSINCKRLGKSRFAKYTWRVYFRN